MKFVEAHANAVVCAAYGKSSPAEITIITERKYGVLRLERVGHYQ